MKRVVITGMGAVTPIGNNVSDMWRAMTAGICGIAPITRFDTSDFKVKIAAEVKNFAPEDFGMDKVEARRMDLYSQYAMAAAREAAEDARLSGIAPERLGVYMGSGIGGMHTFVAETEKLLTRGPSRVSPFYIPMMISNIAAGNIAIAYNAQGPSLPVVSACATSTNTVGEAYRTIKHGYADAIIAGGSEATIEPLAVAGFTNCKALSESQDPNCASLPFDARRAGFVMGEGAGALILEEYENAVRRGAPIYAEIVGYGNTNDAYHMTAPRPDASGSARAFAQAAEEAGLADGETVYINAHGTGTPPNDSAETLAIKKALGEGAARSAMISSTKSMTGHMLGAAGAVELIASVMAIKDGSVPPTINLNSPDPQCDLDYTPNAARNADIHIALSSSLGFGGHNAVIAIRRLI